MTNRFHGWTLTRAIAHFHGWVTTGVLILSALLG